MIPRPFSLLLIALLLGWFIAGPQFVVPVEAQSRESRAERLRQHQRRIQEIINRRRQERAELEAQRKAREAEELAARGITPQEDEVQRERTTRFLSNVVMGLKFLNAEGRSDYNTVVQQGSQFLTEVYLFNVDQNPIDRVRLALDYDKRFIEPVRVFDARLRDYTDSEPLFELMEREAIIRYEAELDRELIAPEFVLLRVLWRAKRVTPFTGITFSFSPLERENEPHTAMLVGNRNILGVESDPADGVLSGGLMIESAEPPEERLLQGKAEELEQIYLGAVAAGASVGLRLNGPQEPVTEGDPFLVSVSLENPEGIILDALDVAILFDPDIVRIVDRDQFNFIRRGTNMHDGPYHRSFPWDIHKRNEVRNERGLATYQMALSNGASLPSRTFLDIYFVALAPTESTVISFVKGRPGAPQLTSTRYFGYEKLDLTPGISRPAIELQVLPAPLEVAEERPREPGTAFSGVATEESLEIRSLRIER